MRTGPNWIWTTCFAGLLALPGCGQSAWGVPVGVVLQVSSIDFQGVAAGSTAAQTLAISNQSGTDVTAIIGPPQGPGSLYFSTSPPANGRLDIGAGKIETLTVTYAPQAMTPDPAEAYFSLRWCESSNECVSLVNLRAHH
jgi:hypothetical protein